MLLDLLKMTKEFPMHFDEGILFKDKNSRGLKREFRERFRNITRIIDCVTCEKCRLWGKLQTQGLGTALKILFIMNDKADSRFHLHRQEVVSLVNGFARLSKSINTLQTFRELLQDVAPPEEKTNLRSVNDELWCCLKSTSVKIQGNACRWWDIGKLPAILLFTFFYV